MMAAGTKIAAMLAITATLLALFSAFAILPATAAYPNVTNVLAKHRHFSTFNSLLVKSGLAAQINSRTAITVLCPPNHELDTFMSAQGNVMDRQTLFNVLSYHVLLDYIDQPRLRSIPSASGTITTTLFQTTGLAAGMNGLANLTSTGRNARNLARVHYPGSPAVAANITSVIDLYPYNISLLAVDAVMVPYGSSLAVSGPVNITQLISQSGNFSAFVSLLSQTGVDSIFQSHDSAPGITVLVPTNAAIQSFQKRVKTTLSASQRVSLVEYHAFPAFYPATELIAAAVPQPTMASGGQPNAFTLYVTSDELTGQVTVHAGRNQANVIANHYSNNPVSIFSIDSVLQPSEIFKAGHNGVIA